jgi:hypothetical protein
MLRRTDRGGTVLQRFAPLVLALVALACSGSAAPVIDPGDGGNYSFDLTPADFVTVIDHPYLPLIPGSRWVYEGEGEQTVVEVLTETRVVMGITATVVRDTVSEEGEVIEDTYDWFAQDLSGNVWYLGEETVEYRDGEPASAAGSWEAGVDGALPGIVMPAVPQVGDAYRQEYYAGQAEDMAEVARIDQTTTIAIGAYSAVIVITEWTPLDAGVVEEKFYAPGVGVIREVRVRGGSGSAELVEFDPGS